MKGKQIITPVFLLLAAIIAGCLGIGYEIGTPLVSFGLITLFLLLAALGTTWKNEESKR